MKNLNTIFKIATLIIIISACSKPSNDVPAPVVTTPTPTPTYSGCRISKIDLSNISYSNSYNKDGLIDLNIGTYVGSGVNNRFQTDFKYENGLLVSLKASNGSGTPDEEKYEYTNGAISKITVVSVSSGSLTGYEIAVKTDANKRIIQTKSSNGYQMDYTRDANGNITTLIYTDTNANKELQKFEFSEYDGKKTILDILKGWQIDVLEFNGNYMYTIPKTTASVGGNVTHIKHYYLGKFDQDLMLSYTYNADGYPTSITEYDDISKKTNYTKKFTYEGCK